MNIGDKIAKARKAQNLTQEQLADLLDVSRQAVSRWESDLAYPETDNLVRLSEILHVNCDYLLKDGVNEAGEKIVEVKIVKDAPRRRELNFRFVFMLFLLALGAYFALFGTWNLALELGRAAVLRRETGVLIAVGICGAVGYAMLAYGAYLWVSCAKRREYLFKRED